eukprot:1211773-Pleurochrysis_carterae.AAC.1
MQSDELRMCRIKLSTEGREGRMRGAKTVRSARNWSMRKRGVWAEARKGREIACEVAAEYDEGESGCDAPHWKVTSFVVVGVAQHLTQCASQKKRPSGVETAREAHAAASKFRNSRIVKERACELSRIVRARVRWSNRLQPRRPRRDVLPAVALLEEVAHAAAAAAAAREEGVAAVEQREHQPVLGALLLQRVAEVAKGVGHRHVADRVDVEVARQQPRPARVPRHLRHVVAQLHQLLRAHLGVGRAAAARVRRLQVRVENEELPRPNLR